MEPNSFNRKTFSETRLRYFKVVMVVVETRFFPLDSDVPDQPRSEHQTGVPGQSKREILVAEERIANAILHSIN